MTSTCYKNLTQVEYVVSCNSLLIGLWHRWLMLAAKDALRKKCGSWRLFRLDTEIVTRFVLAAFLCGLRQTCFIYASLCFFLDIFCTLLLLLLQLLWLSVYYESNSLLHPNLFIVDWTSSLIHLSIELIWSVIMRRFELKTISCCV